MRTTGTVLRYKAGRGFGFITRDDGERDVFVHHTALQDGSPGPLEKGDKVEFDVVDGPKGPAAANVVKL
jgi:CspA family cold shock protein